jgi:hypothetical protein
LLLTQFVYFYVFIGIEISKPLHPNRFYFIWKQNKEKKHFSGSILFL